MPASVTAAPEVPGVLEELSPALSVLGGSDVAGGDLFSSSDLESCFDFHFLILRIVLTCCVAPYNFKFDQFFFTKSFTFDRMKQSQF